jgi:hypothetical protein
VGNQVQVQADVDDQAAQAGLQQQFLAIDRNGGRMQNPDREDDRQPGAENAEG